MLCFVFVFAILLLVVVCASFIVCVPVICPVSVFVTVLPDVGSQLILTLLRKGEVMYWRRGALVGLLVTLCCAVLHIVAVHGVGSQLILSLWRREALVGLLPAGCCVDVFLCCSVLLCMAMAVS